MEYLWINKNNNKNLILIFNGWAMNETPFKHLKSSNFDVLTVYDYRSLDFDFSKFGFEKYEKKYLICWSMGVFCANKFKNILDLFDKKIAINGTFQIVSDDFGIPKKIYHITAKLLNENSREKFIKNMFKNGTINPNITITREIKELQEELFKIAELELKDETDYDKIIISSDDRIIPSKNQINFWKAKGKENKIQIINSTHCPFEMYSSFEEIIC